MEHSIRFKTEELNATLIEGLKKYFRATKTKEVVINFSTPGKKFLRDETQAETNARIEKRSPMQTLAKPSGFLLAAMSLKNFQKLY